MSSVVTLFFLAFTLRWCGAQVHPELRDDGNIGNLKCLSTGFEYELVDKAAFAVAFVDPTDIGNTAVYTVVVGGDAKKPECIARKGDGFHFITVPYEACGTLVDQQNNVISHRNTVTITIRTWYAPMVYFDVKLSQALSCDLNTQLDITINPGIDDYSNTLPSNINAESTTSTDFPLTTTEIYPENTTYPDGVELCDVADSIDLGPDNKYYFFTGSYFYTTDPKTNIISLLRPIATEFADIKPPVIAAFTVGPLNPRMFLIDSSDINVVKVYHFKDDGVRPRTAQMSVDLAKFFPSSDAIPVPLTSAMASLSPARVFFTGGPPSQRNTTIYSFRTNYVIPSFQLLGHSTAVQEALKSDIIASTRYYFPNNGSTTLIAFSKDQAVQTRPNFEIINGPEDIQSCPAWLPLALVPTCCKPEMSDALTPQSPTTQNVHVRKPNLKIKLVKHKKFNDSH